MSELQGQLTGAITVTGTLETGLSVGFNVRGTDLDWGTYDINTIAAQGRFANGLLSVSPVRIDLNGGTLAFSGQVGAETLNGQLRVSSVPLELLQPFFNRLPSMLQVNSMQRQRYREVWRTQARSEHSILSMLVSIINPFNKQHSIFAMPILVSILRVRFS